MASNGEEGFVEQLYSAIESNDMSLLKSLLDKFSTPKYQNGFAHEALDKALELRRYDMADELFKRGMRWSYSTMDSVLEGGDESNNWNIGAIDVALANGWDINEHYDGVGNALVHVISVDDNNIPVVTHLLDKGADPNKGSQSSTNPLEMASGNGDKDMVELLLARGATVKNTRALLEASEGGDVEVVKLLLDNGADINGRPDENSLPPRFAEDEGWGSALHGAVGSRNVECVKFLLEKGASRDVTSPKGLTPLDLAKKRGYEEITKLLEQ